MRSRSDVNDQKHEIYSQMTTARVLASTVHR